jgi:hypothetical protein
MRSTSRDGTSSRWPQCGRVSTQHSQVALVCQQRLQQERQLSPRLRTLGGRVSRRLFQQPADVRWRLQTSLGLRSSVPSRSDQKPEEREKDRATQPGGPNDDKGIASAQG